MKHVRLVLFFSMFFLMHANARSQTRFGESLCHAVNYFCLHIQNDDTWDDLFPNDEERDIVQRINRMNVELQPGMIIAVPKNIDQLSIYDVSPFPREIKPIGEKAIYVSQRILAWGAYDETGKLLWWGPLSSGSGDCKGSREACTTPSGAFRIIRKQDEECISTAFPMQTHGENGGAPMPYCMHFFRGFALHGSDTVPGYRASHGCVRLFVEDARWLNEEFINLPGVAARGTRVIIDSIDG